MSHSTHSFHSFESRLKEHSKAPSACRLSILEDVLSELIPSVGSGALSALILGIAATSIGLLPNTSWAAGTTKASASAAASAAKAKSAPAVVQTSGGEDWKGPLSDRDVVAGFVVGLGLVEPKYGPAMQGQISKRIIPGGFVPEITNPVSLEISAGPSFISGHAPFVFSTHLRWDFEKDSEWTLFAVGGVGGQITGPELGDRSLVHLRIGAGAFYHLQGGLSLRMEASHEMLGLGVGVAL